MDQPPTFVRYSKNGPSNVFVQKCPFYRLLHRFKNYCLDLYHLFCPFLLMERDRDGCNNVFIRLEIRDNDLILSCLMVTYLIWFNRILGIVGRLLFNFFGFRPNLKKTWFERLKNKCIKKLSPIVLLSLIWVDTIFTEITYLNYKKTL